MSCQKCLSLRAKEPIQAHLALSSKGLMMAVRPPKFSQHLFRDAFLSLGIFLLLSAAVHFVLMTERSRHNQALRANITEKVAFLRTALEAELNTNVFLANGLAAHVIAVPELEDQTITTALRTLYRLGKHIRNVGVAPNNRITHVYPLEGNEAAIGLDFTDHPSQWNDVKRAMESRETVLAGPIELVQGGSGLISRTPVFKEDGTYWGMINIVLDSSSVLDAVKLAPERDGIHYAIMARQGSDTENALILGTPELFTEDRVQMPISVPGGQWVLAARPVAGWQRGAGLAFGIELVALVLNTGLSILFFLFLRKRAALAASEHRTRAFLETTRDGVVVIDDRGLIREFNAAAETMFGYQTREVIGTSINRLMFSDVAEKHDAYLRSSQAHGSDVMGGRRDVIARRKDGTAVPVEINVSNTIFGGERLHVGVLRDITKRKELEEQLRLQANTDFLTGTMNRRAFMEALQHAFELARRHDRALALLLLDADHFKRVNDTHGHPVGDMVLLELARIGTSRLRAADRMGRVGGEEFAFLLPETDATGAITFAERLLSAIRAARVDIGGKVSLSFTVSIGIAVKTLDIRDHETLLRCADQALYAAKKGGRNRWARHGCDIQAHARRTHEANAVAA
jgi:diguanylate cyclase (GGDEF)-like protein/PAS domain S-box-containing protein